VHQQPPRRALNGDTAGVWRRNDAHAPPFSVWPVGDLSRARRDRRRHFRGAILGRRWVSFSFDGLWQFGYRFDTF
jgi:hypothetical protein